MCRSDQFGEEHGVRLHELADNPDFGFGESGGEIADQRSRAVAVSAMCASFRHSSFADDAPRMRCAAEKVGEGIAHFSPRGATPSAISTAGTGQHDTSRSIGFPTRVLPECFTLPESSRTIAGQQVAGKWS